MISFEIDNVSFNLRAGGISIRDNKVLLNKVVNAAYWFIPGGRIEGSETSKEALIREMYEEIGERILVNDLICVVENFFENGKSFHEIGFYYYMNAGSSVIGSRIISEGLIKIEYKWIDINDLEAIILYPKVIKDIILGKATGTHFIQRD
jgi:8-oxo-dGTP pyrophosphatase MutT (NUDIX family)